MEPRGNHQVKRVIMLSKQVRVFLVCLLAIGMTVLGSTVAAQADISFALIQIEITDKLDSLVRAVNIGDTQTLVELISPDDPALRAEVLEGVQKITSYQLSFGPRNISLQDTGAVRVRARYDASGPGWSSSGFSTYFVFEKQYGQWLITDTDFHRKVGGEFVAERMMMLFYIAGPIVLVALALANRRKISLRTIANDRSTWSLLAVNGVTMILALALNWSLSTLLLIYWIQSVEIGVFHLIRMVRQGENSGCSKLSDPTFFASHYGGIHFVYLLFIRSGMFGEGAVPTAEVGVIVATSLLFFGNHLFSYLRNIAAETRRQDVKKMMFEPYARVIPMHLAIIFGAVTHAALPFFLVLKTVADLIAHVRQHTRLREDAQPQVAQEKRPGAEPDS